MQKSSGIYLRNSFNFTEIRDVNYSRGLIRNVAFELCDTGYFNDRSDTIHFFCFVLRVFDFVLPNRRTECSVCCGTKVGYISVPASCMYWIAVFPNRKQWRQALGFAESLGTYSRCIFILRSCNVKCLCSIYSIYLFVFLSYWDPHLWNIIGERPSLK